MTDDPSSIEKPREGDIKVSLLPKTLITFCASAQRPKFERLTTHVTVSRNSDTDHNTTNGPHPSWRFGVLGGEQTSVPHVVNDSEGTDGVGSVVRAVSERIGASGENLEERVQVLGLGSV